MRVPLTSLTLMVALAACSDGSKIDGNAQAGASYNLNDAAIEAESLNQAGIVNTAGSTLPAPQSLEPYVGKYPFDKVNGVAFLDHPDVKAAVEQAVADPKIRDWILKKAGPQTPIAKIDGRYAAWGCQQSNCGSHHWTVFVSPERALSSVCYLPDGATQAEWYEQGRKIARTDACRSE